MYYEIKTFLNFFKWPYTLTNTGRKLYEILTLKVKTFTKSFYVITYIKSVVYSGKKYIRIL